MSENKMRFWNTFYYKAMESLQIGYFFKFIFLYVYSVCLKCGIKKDSINKCLKVLNFTMNTHFLKQIFKGTK